MLLQLLLLLPANGGSMGLAAQCSQVWQLLLLMLHIQVCMGACLGHTYYLDVIQVKLIILSSRGYKCASRVQASHRTLQMTAI
jgi:hypothetical protein